MDKQLALDLADAYTAYAQRLGAPALGPVKSGTMKKSLTHEEWSTRVYAALRFVNDAGGTVPWKAFRDYCVKTLGYSAQGIGSYYNKPDAVKKLHLTGSGPTATVSVTVAGCDFINNYEETHAA